MTSNAPSNDIQVVASQVVLSNPTRGPLFYGTLLFASRRTLPGEDCDAEPPVLCALEDITNEKFLDGRGPTTMSLYGVVVAHSIREDGSAGEVLSYSYYGPRDSLDYWHNILVRPNDPVGVLFLWEPPAAGSWKLVEDPHSPKLPLIFVYSGDIAAQYGADIETFIALLSPDEQTKYKTILERSDIHYHFVRVGGMDRIHIVRHETVPHRAAVLNRRNVHFGMDNFLQTRIFIDHCSGLYERDGDTLKEVSKHSMYASYAKSYANKMAVGGLSASAIYNLQRELLHLVWRRDDPATSLGEAEEMDTESGQTGAELFTKLGEDLGTELAACLAVYARMPRSMCDRFTGTAMGESFAKLSPVQQKTLTTVLQASIELLAGVFAHPDACYAAIAGGGDLGLDSHDVGIIFSFLRSAGVRLPVDIPDAALSVFQSRCEWIRAHMAGTKPSIGRDLFTTAAPVVVSDAIASCTGPFAGIWQRLHDTLYSHLSLDDVLAQLGMTRVEFDTLGSISSYTSDAVDTVALRRLWDTAQAGKIILPLDAEIDGVFWKIAAEDDTTTTELELFASGDVSRADKTREQCCFALLKSNHVKLPAYNVTYTPAALRDLETCVRLALKPDHLLAPFKYIAAFASSDDAAFGIVATLISDGLGSEKEQWFVPLTVRDVEKIARVLWCFTGADTIKLTGAIVADDMVKADAGVLYTSLCNAMQIAPLKSVEILPAYKLGVFAYALRRGFLYLGSIFDNPTFASVYLESVVGGCFPVTTALTEDEQSLMYHLWFDFVDSTTEIAKAISFQMPTTKQPSEWEGIAEQFVGSSLTYREFFVYNIGFDIAAYTFNARMPVECILQVPTSKDDATLLGLWEGAKIQAPFSACYENGEIVRDALLRFDARMKLDAFSSVCVDLLSDVSAFSSLKCALFGLDKESCPTAPIDGIDDLAAVLKSIVAFLPTDLLASHGLPTNMHGREGVLQFVQGWARTLLVDSLMSNDTTRCVSYLDVVTAADSLFDAGSVKPLDSVFGFTDTKPFQADSETCKLVSENYKTLRTDDGKARAREVCTACVQSLEARLTKFQADTDALATRIATMALSASDSRLVDLCFEDAKKRGEQWVASVRRADTTAMRDAVVKQLQLNDLSGLLKSRQRIFTKMSDTIGTFLSSPTCDTSFSVFSAYDDVMDISKFTEEPRDGLVASAATLAGDTVETARGLQKKIDAGESLNDSEDGFGLSSSPMQSARSSVRPSPSASPTPDTQQLLVHIPAPVAITLRNRRPLVIAAREWNNNPYYMDGTRTVPVSAALLPILCGTLDSDSEPVYSGATARNNFGALFSCGFSHSMENYLVDPFLVVPNTLKSVGLQFTLHDAGGSKYTSLAGHTFQDIFNALYGKPKLYADIGIGVHVVMARAIMTALSSGLYGVESVKLPESLVAVYISACCPRGSLLGDVLKTTIELSGEPCRILNYMNMRTADSGDSFMYQRYRKACLDVHGTFSVVDLLAWFAYATVAEFLMVTGVDDYKDSVSQQSWIPSIDGLVFWSADRTAGDETCPVKLVDGLGSALGQEYSALLGALRGHCASTQSLLRFVVDTGKFRKKSAFYCRLVVTVGADDALYYTTPGSPNWQTCGGERCTVSAVVPYWATVFDVPLESSIVIGALDVPSRLLQRLYFGAILDGYAAIDVPPWILRTVNGDAVSFVVSGTSIELASSGKLTIHPLQLYKKGYTPKAAGVQEKIGFCAHPVLVWDFNDSKNPFVFAFYLGYVDNVGEIYSCENGLGRSVRMVTSTAAKKLTGLNARSVKAIINGGWSFDITS